MEFDKKKIGIALFSTLILGSVIAYGSWTSKDNQPEETNSSQVASPIERAKGKTKKDKVIQKPKKNESKKSVIENLFGEESEASVIDGINDGEKQAISRDPISDIMSDIDRQAKMQEDKAKNNLKKEPTVPAENNQAQTADSPKDINNETNDTKKPGPVEVPNPIEPTPEPPITPNPPIEIVNYDGLISILEQASQISRSNYTPNSLSVLDTETRTGYNMISTQTYTQAQVNSQITNIQNAIHSLVIKADKTSLSAIITTALEVDQTIYTPETVDKLASAITEAQAVKNDENATQVAVDIQVDSLQTAIDQLMKKGDKTELTSVINEAVNINRDIYTDESLEKLDSSITVAKQVQEDQNASQTEVDQAKNDLRNTIDTLQEKEEPEKTLVLIRQLIAECESLAQSDYTPQSYQVLENELALAKSLIDKSDVTIAEASAQLNSLENAKNQLVRRADTSKLQNVINEANSLSESEYTDATWSALQAALTGAEALKDNPDATQNQLDQKETEIRTAISALEKK
jgi:plasmid stabilization system protein ParE